MLSNDHATTPQKQMALLKAALIGAAVVCILLGKHAAVLTCSAYKLPQQGSA
jgi:hypothetical protein